MEANELRVLTVAEVKLQLSMDWDDENDLLTQLALSAEDAVIDETRRSYDELCLRGYADKTGDTSVVDVDSLPAGDWFPSRLRQAMLLVVENLYRNRGMTTAAAVNNIGWTYNWLVKPYRKLV